MAGVKAFAYSRRRSSGDGEINVLDAAQFATKPVWGINYATHERFKLPQLESPLFAAAKENFTAIGALAPI